MNGKLLLVALLVLAIGLSGCLQQERPRPPEGEIWFYPTSFDECLEAGGNKGLARLRTEPYYEVCTEEGCTGVGTPPHKLPQYEICTEAIYEDKQKQFYERCISEGGKVLEDRIRGKVCLLQFESEKTCAEMGRQICSEDDFCGTVVIAADTNRCCDNICINVNVFVNVCEKLAAEEPKPPQIDIDRCFIDAADKKNDLTLCDIIQTSEMRERCVDKVLTNIDISKGLSLCDSLAISKEYCTEALLSLFEQRVTLTFEIPYEITYEKPTETKATLKTDDLSLKNAALELVLPDGIEVVEDKRILLGDIGENQVKEVSWQIVGEKAGLYDVVLSLFSTNGADITESKLIAVTRIEIRKLSINKETYLPNDIVTIASEITNFNPEVTYVNIDLNLTITNPEDKNTYLQAPEVILYAGQTQETTVNWEQENKTKGKYSIKAYLYDYEGILMDSTSTTFTVK